jgi:leader peptidase (prepilin peptidase)/N-methyltransferase
LWFGAAAVTLAVIDVEHHRLPDRLIYPSYGAELALLGIAALIRHEATAYLRALLAMTVLFVAFFILAAVVGSPGFGDLKLAGLIGLVLGWLGTWTVVTGVFAGLLLGGLLAAALMAAARDMGWSSQFAYGPPLLAGALLAILLHS